MADETIKSESLFQPILAWRIGAKGKPYATIYHSYIGGDESRHILKRFPLKKEDLELSLNELAKMYPFEKENENVKN